jgi:hypothetical protein
MKKYSWTAVNSGLTNTDIRSLTVSDSTIFAGTWGGGVWRRSLSEITGSANAHPRRKLIHQASFKIGPPGGAVSVVAIEFTIPHSDHVAITMYDPTGRIVTSLVNQQLGAGSYRYSLDTHTFARGCYAVRMQTGATMCMRLVRIMH